MRKRSASLPLIVLVAVIALVLGSFGTATAAGLTAGKVKKIATKVVNKKAPSLSVAHAVTADTATNATNAVNLNGQPASAYQNVSFRYRLPTQAAATDKVYNFPGLPTGTYLFTYSVIVTGGSATTFCYMRPTAANTNGDGFTYMVTNGGLSTVSSSGIVQGVGTAINMRCAGTSFAMYNLSDVSSSVTFTRIDTLTNSNGTAPRGSDGGSVSGNLATAN
jgi:hypothetical protein